MNLGTGVRVVATDRQFSQGNIVTTGNPLDVAINGRGFFEILLPDGSQAYSRDGTFQINADGQLVTSSGYTVQPAITIPAGASGRHDRRSTASSRRSRRAKRTPCRSARCSSRIS